MGNLKWLLCSSAAAQLLMCTARQAAACRLTRTRRGSQQAAEHAHAAHVAQIDKVGPPAHCSEARQKGDMTFCNVHFQGCRFCTIAAGRQMRLGRGGAAHLPRSAFLEKVTALYSGSCSSACGQVRACVREAPQPAAACWPMGRGAPGRPYQAMHRPAALWHAQTAVRSGGGHTQDCAPGSPEQCSCRPRWAPPAHPPLPARRASGVQWGCRGAVGASMRSGVHHMRRSAVHQQASLLAPARPVHPTLSRPPTYPPAPHTPPPPAQQNRTLPLSTDSSCSPWKTSGALKRSVWLTMRRMTWRREGLEPGRLELHEGATRASGMQPGWRCCRQLGRIGELGSGAASALNRQQMIVQRPPLNGP